MSTFFQDLRFALRQLSRSPGFTAITVLSLALGIGANAAIFSLSHQVLLQPLDVPEPHRLVNLTSPGPLSGSISCGQAGSCEAIFSYPMSRDLQAAQPHDPRVLLTGTLLLVLVALTAGYLPARRAARVEPMIALRNE